MNRVRAPDSASQRRIHWHVNSDAIGIALVWWTGDGQGNSIGIEPARLRVSSWGSGCRDREGDLRDPGWRNARMKQGDRRPVSCPPSSGVA